MLLEVPDCSGKLLLSRHAVCPPIRYYSEASLIDIERKLEKGTEKDDEKAPKNEKDEPKEIVKENWLLKLQRDIKNKKKLITPQKVTPSKKRLVKTPAAHGRSVREIVMSLEKKKK